MRDIFPAAAALIAGLARSVSAAPAYCLCQSPDSLHIERCLPDEQHSVRCTVRSVGRLAAGDCLAALKVPRQQRCKIVSCIAWLVRQHLRQHSFMPGRSAYAQFYQILPKLKLTQQAVPLSMAGGTSCLRSSIAELLEKATRLFMPSCCSAQWVS